MGGFAPINTIKLYQEAIRRAGRDGLSMRLRLFGFLLLFLNIIMVGVLVYCLPQEFFRPVLKSIKPCFKMSLRISRRMYIVVLARSPFRR